MPSLSRGQIVGDRYRILQWLGRGGMGEVWLAFDLKLRLEVALKSTRHDFDVDERRLERLRDEVRLAREVLSPNVCRVFDLQVVDGHELVSMEYIDGRTLAETLRERGPLEIREASEIACQLLSGIAAIHDAGFVHRDLKPENVMITRVGRVVIMDFGVARAAADTSPSVSGTQAYMAPEQARGEPVDPRTDLFAAGMVLAEMVSVEDGSIESRRKLWDALRTDPSTIPDTPWSALLSRAVAQLPDDRFGSAREMLRAIETAKLRVRDEDSERPYPGLSMFTEEDAEYFFGREAEVEAVWKKLRRPHLMALIGPSGAGKSSFLRAGLIPAKPDGWRCVVSQPGAAPFRALAKALAAQLSGDPEAVEDLVGFDDPDAGVRVVRRWRGGAAEAVVVLDQFEELFTLNPREVQERFASMLGRLPLEADVRVLLSMRDDFLFRCHGHEALAPLFSELTPLGAPTGAALRRALVQPALRCGYRFEDEDLVDEMLSALHSERGALPLLAFAASRLWDRRDRASGMLTRRAYEEIGGVGGALARHAEATLERLSESRRELVREVFRNLVTAEGTRATREMNELLSVFHDRIAAREVLGSLVDARLLTTYDVSAVGGDEPQQNVEIVHESLLEAWPRLVRWRTQDEDGAQLRDQLRQAARMWEERDHSEDLLWSGSAYLDYRAWRGRYAGGLSDLEEAFANAMVEKANRLRRRRRIAAGIAMGVLLVVLMVVGNLWRQSEKAVAATEVARQEAVSKERLAEARRVVGLARGELDSDPRLSDRTHALAYLVRSLRIADTNDARELAVEVLWQGPSMAGNLPGRTFQTGAVSPDGRYLAWSTYDGVTLLSSSGAPRLLAPAVGREHEFSPDGRYLLVRSGETWATEKPDSISVFEVSSGTKVVSLEVRGTRLVRLTSQALLTVSTVDGGILIRHHPFDEKREPFEERLDAPLAVRAERRVVGDAGLKRLAYLGRDRRPRVVDLAGDRPRITTLDPDAALASGEWGREKGLLYGAFQPGGSLFAAMSGGQQLLIWDLERGPKPIRELTTNGLDGGGGLAIAPGGDLLAVGGESVELWPLNAPATARRWALHVRDTMFLRPVFDPSGRWLITGSLMGLDLWPVVRTPAIEVPSGHRGWIWHLDISPDGALMVSEGSDGRTRITPMRALDGRPFDLRGPNDKCSSVSFTESSEEVLALCDGKPVLISVATGRSRPAVPSNPEVTLSGAMRPSRSGRFLAAAGNTKDKDAYQVRVVDRETGELRVFGPAPPVGSPTSVSWGPDDTWLVSRGYVWDLDSGTIHKLPVDGSGIVSDDGKNVFLTWGTINRGTRYDGGVGRLELASGEMHTFPGWGNDFQSLRLAPGGTRLSSGGVSGIVRVGSTQGGEPHLLIGHRVWVFGKAFSHDGTLLATSDANSMIRLWKLPPLDRPPVHSLPREELVSLLESLTAYRAVEDPASSTGFSFEAMEFPRWVDAPEW